MKLRIITSLFLLSILLFPKNSFAATEKDINSSAKLEIKSSPNVAYDKRTKLLSEYLKQYNSPLIPYVNDFVREADENKIDWRLLVAISGVESTFGQFLIENSYNAWGWGIYGDNAIYFSSYSEAIKTISKSLREDYVDKWGAKDVYEIGKFYAASPYWAQKVTYLMNRIDEFAAKNPTETLSISL